jgi:hypothetical protein
MVVSREYGSRGISTVRSHYIAMISEEAEKISVCCSDL